MSFPVRGRALLPAIPARFIHSSRELASRDAISIHPATGFVLGDGQSGWKNGSFQGITVSLLGKGEAVSGGPRFWALRNALNVRRFPEGGISSAVFLQFGVFPGTIAADTCL
jgi:hypothetical protein